MSGEDVGREKASCVDNANLRRALSFEEDDDEKRFDNQFIVDVECRQRQR